MAKKNKVHFTFDVDKGLKQRVDSDMRAIVSIVDSACKIANRNYVTEFEIAQCVREVQIPFDKLKEKLDGAWNQKYISRHEARFYELTQKGLNLLER